MIYYTYLLKSISPGTKKTYAGYTLNLKERLKKHNSNNGAKSTKGRKWKIIYTKSFKTKKEAMSYEYKLKKDKLYRKNIIQNYSV